MTTDATNLPDALYRKLVQGQQKLPSAINPHFEKLKTLGYGYEGYVYLVRDRSTGRRYVLKIYHDPFDHEPLIWDGLQLYADRVKSNKYGLYEISVTHESGQIVASQYPYDRLSTVDFRIYLSSGHTGQALLGQFCLMQWYLMSQHGLGIIDPVMDNFLLAHDGQFHYIDYGLGIRSVTESVAHARGLFGYGFALLLLSLHNINLRLEMPSSPNYSYNTPCIYSLCKALDDVAARHVWVRNILSEVRRHNASVFLDPQFYWRVGMSLPRRVRFPQLVISTSLLLSSVRKVRDWTRTKTPA